MLLEIAIKNFAIIEEISLNFEKGMTVLTGETGAGKSIAVSYTHLENFEELMKLVHL